MEKIDIKGLFLSELEEKLRGIGAPAYRAKQIFSWLYKRGAKSFGDMNDLPKDLREKLESIFRISSLAVLDRRESRIDGTTKYLFRLEDSNTIETVFLPDNDRATICLSSQVGCKFGCSFCASAPFGFKRDLSAGEMLNEVIEVHSLHPNMPITNLVFMGIGEPFDNYDNLMRAIRLLNSEEAFNIGARRITVSTCGVIPKIEAFAEEGLQIELSVSLHSAKDEVRSKLVPVNKKYPLNELMKACKAYIERTGRVITFEYILIKGVNISKSDALALVKLLKGIKCKVNTISCNKVAALGTGQPDPGSIKEFLSTLKENGVNVIHRKSKGEDIDAGCGQLRISRL